MACKSKSGAAAGPFLRLLLPDGACLSIDVDDAFSCFRRTRDPVLCPFGGEGEPLRNFVDGRMSFFCLEAGSISSRSTGTPNDTRNSRRIRERTQLGGCNGGGATSCDQSERLLSVRKMELELGGGGAGSGYGFLVVGNISSRYEFVASTMSSRVSKSLKSSNGWQIS